MKSDFTTFRLFTEIRHSCAQKRNILYYYHLYKRVRINKSIAAPELRVIDNEGKNLGVISLEEALRRAQERELDLIEIAPNAKPPVAKIMDYGKYRYIQERKTRGSAKSRQVEVKGVQIGINTSKHDLEMKAKKTSEFLKNGDRVRVELRLKGRERYLQKEFLEGRLKRVLDFIIENYQIVEGPAKSPRGLYMLLERKK